MNMGNEALANLAGGQDAVIGFLSDPAAYGTDAPVERVDTHAAIVFLVGERAFKLKRAVRLPYLDFSTVAKRKAVCEAELALNRRTAPDLYLHVTFVGRLADGSLALGEGSPIDWLVVMQRFASECLLSTMAERGALDRATMFELADAVARFHDAADIVAGTGADRVCAVIEGNRASMDALPPESLAADQAERLCSESLAMARDLTPLLDRRAGAGSVRHCHGDLHLANICIWQGRPTPFDCLEFDAALATSDVLYDLAFLLMDLWQRGLHGEASAVFNRYCDRRAETDGLAALPLFLSMRAAVRAHAEASAAERQQAVAARDSRLAVARGYLTSALSLLDRPAPRLIAVGGISGSGKSLLAAGLAPSIGTAPGARWLRSDVLRKQLVGVDPESRLPDSAYTAEAHRTVYAALQQQVRETLAAGWPAVADAVFDSPMARAQMEDIARDLAVPFTGLWLEADREILQARVRGRTGDASDAGPAVVDKQLQRDIGPLGGWHRIDASGSAEQTLALARAHLEAR